MPWAVKSDQSVVRRLWFFKKMFRSFSRFSFVTLNAVKQQWSIHWLIFFWEPKELDQGSGTHGSRARGCSFEDPIWLAWYFVNTTFTDETLSVIFLQIHRQHHISPDVALTLRSMLLRENSDIYHGLNLLILLKNVHVKCWKILYGSHGNTIKNM